MRILLPYLNVQFTTQAVHELFEHGIEMAILTRYGKLIGQITSPATKNITLRLHQFNKYWDEGFRLMISKRIVSGKINNSLSVIRLFSYNHPEIDFKDEVYNLQTRLEKTESITSIGQLLGLEGASAKDYFCAFSKMILGDYDFRVRKKHPSTDPVNALLSLSYTMIYNEISSLLDGIGFDPYLGYYHDIEYGRASLASDLMEEFRGPVADRLTLNLINNQVFTTQDFHKNPMNNAVFLNHDALKKYFIEYERFLNHEFTHPLKEENTTYRKCFRIQAENLASCIKNENEYIPFLLKV